MIQTQENGKKPRSGQTDGLTETEGQTDKSDFIGRCPTNVERPKHISCDCKCEFNSRKCKSKTE